MNTPIKHFALFSILALGLFGTANAQRGERGGGSRSFDRSGGGDRRSGGFSQSPSSNRQNNGSFDRQSRNSGFDNRAGSVTPRIQNNNFGNRNVIARSSTERRLDLPRTNNTFNQQRVPRTVSVYNNNRIVNSYRYPTVNRYSYSPHRYVYVGAPRYSVLPHGSLTIRFGGYPYYYHSGLFYGYYNGFYEPVFAPIGIHVSILPTGYYPFYLGSNRYYYYDGIYYRNYNDNQYEVIDAPLGAQVSMLPKGATAATINGEKFYEFNGTYYKEGTNSRNEVVYTVVGKYGHINNTDDEPVSDLQQPALHEGDVIPVLPDGCKEVSINGEQLYVSPDNTYFKSQNIDGNTSYKIVGTGTAKQ
jgi:hypothetical protein